MAKAALLVYNDDWASVESWLKRHWKITFFKSFAVNNTESFVAGDDRYSLFVFRGTQDLNDWQKNLNVKLVQSPYGKVHNGFKKALDDVFAPMFTTIRDHKAPIWIAGHSLGGAIATLAAMYLILGKRDIAGIYTFGSPRVGNATFARKLDQKIKHRYYRFVNNEDIVTRVPPRLLKYHHVGNMRYFDTGGKLHLGINWWRQFLDVLESREKRSLARYQELQHQFPNGLDDHKMENYLKLIRKAMTTQQRRAISSKPARRFDRFLDFINR